MAIKRSHAGGALRKKLVSTVAAKPEDGAGTISHIHEDDEHNKELQEIKDEFAKYKEQVSLRLDTYGRQIRQLLPLIEPVETV